MAFRLHNDGSGKGILQIWSRARNERNVAPLTLDSMRKLLIATY